MADQTLTRFDQELADKVILKNNLSGKVIKFQFPPKIKTESKESNWESIDVKSFEPIKTYQGSGPRSLSMEFEYIATGSGDFTPSKIAEYLRNVKEYYYRANILKFKTKYPTFDLIIYDIVPLSAKFRLHGTSITYSDAIVKSGGKVFPLHTSVSLSLELATSVTFPSGKPQQVVSPLEVMNEKGLWF